MHGFGRCNYFRRRCDDIFWHAKNIALGENDVYICEHWNKAEHVKYDEIKFYKIDDKETDSEEYILVKDNDYKNYSTFFKSDDLSKDAQALFEKR